jgi:hypothetical protein
MSKIGDVVIFSSLVPNTDVIGHIAIILEIQYHSEIAYYYVRYSHNDIFHSYALCPSTWFREE